MRYRIYAASKLSEKRRKCRYRKENHGLKLFRQYSQDACEFECQIEMATTKCGCVPWDYPQLLKEGLLQVCEGWGRYCFKSVLKDSNKKLNNCGHCVPDCTITRYIICYNQYDLEKLIRLVYIITGNVQTTSKSFLFRYSYSVSSTVLNIKSICDSNPKDLEPFYYTFGRDFSDKALPPTFMRRYQQVVYGVDIGGNEICKKNLETGLAVVKFQLAAQKVTQIEKKLRYSDADHISSLGMFVAPCTNDS